jgi:hypothetical protein
MPRKKYAPLAPQLLAHRRKRRAATVPLAFDHGEGEDAAPARARRDRPRAATARPPAADLSAVPIVPPALEPIASEGVFHRKGAASAAAFRPRYWQY